MGGPPTARRVKPATPPDVMRLSDLADYLQIGIDYAQELVKTGQIPARRLGTGPRGTIRVRKCHVDAYLDGEVSTATAETSAATPVVTPPKRRGSRTSTAV